MSMSTNVGLVKQAISIPGYPNRFSYNPNPASEKGYYVCPSCFEMSLIRFGVCVPFHYGSGPCRDLLSPNDLVYIVGPQTTNTIFPNIDVIRNTLLTRQY